MNKKVFFFHALCFIGVVSVASLFLFYQVFVDEQSRKISIKSFFTPPVFSKATSLISRQENPFRIENVWALYWQHPDGGIERMSGGIIIKIPEFENRKVFTVGSAIYLSHFKDNTLIIDQFQYERHIEIPLDATAQYEVLGWLDEKNIIVAKKQTTSQVVKINIDSLANEVLIPEIVTQADSLFKTFNGSSPLLAYPECSPKCHFVIFDLQKKEVVQKVPAFTEPSKQSGTNEVELMFFDAKTGYLGYQIPENDSMYVIDRELNLLQLIRLENDRNTAHFIAYYPQTEQLLFSLTENDGSEQTVVAVSAKDPSLHILTKTSEYKEVIASPLAESYQLGSIIYELNGKKVKDVENGDLYRFDGENLTQLNGGVLVPTY